MIILTDRQSMEAKNRLQYLKEQLAPTEEIEAVHDAMIDYESVRWPDDYSD